MRIEFVATDLDASGDSTGANEGFFRVYTANAGQRSWLRARLAERLAAVGLVAAQLRRLAQGRHER